MLGDGWFKINGHWSEEVTAFIRQRPEKVKAKRIFTLDEVPGVNKLVAFDKGYYTNAEQTISCFYLARDEEEIQVQEDRITDILDTRGEYVEFIPYYDPAHMYDVVVINEPMFSGVRGTGLAVPFSFDISIAPFKYSRSGQILKDFTAPFTIENPYNYESYPYFKIFGQGNLSLIINGRETIFKNVEDFIEIDSNPDICEVFKEENGILLNMNKKFYSQQRFPYFDKKTNKVTFKGNVTKVSVEPRWQTKI